MQQTTSREFSIIESSDPFLPEALNDNTRKIEAALDAHETQTKAVTDALDARITTLEGHKMTWGYYKGDNTATRFIPLPFTPGVVLVVNTNNSYSAMGVLNHQGSTRVKPVENGMQLHRIDNTVYDTNTATYGYFYIALC